MTPLGRAVRPLVETLCLPSPPFLALFVAMGATRLKDYVSDPSILQRPDVQASVGVVGARAPHPPPTAPPPNPLPPTAQTSRPPLPLHNAHPPNPQAIIANNTLLTRPPPPVPTLIFNIKVDELVDPQAQAAALARAWCAAGGTVELQMLPAAEHGVGALANLVPQLLWLGDAFAGRGLAPPGTCVGVE